MCGIAGAIDWNSERALRRVTELNRCQQHRGPDHTALVWSSPFALGNTRLAIQDPTPAGNQPFRSVDGRYLSVFNGEIYNYKELIRQFGLELPNHCDGAVIPELWSRLGPACLRLFRGMYAIALVDTKTETVSLCRDPFGIKPLYVRHLADSTVVFGSEVRPLAAVEPASTVTAEAVARFLHLGALPADASPFDDIIAVPPNTVLTMDGAAAKTFSAIIPGSHPLIESDKDRPPGPTDLGQILGESVSLHLRSDVPVVLLLSSGVDSTALASAARHSDRDLHCMTVAGLGGADESGAAAATAAHYGHTHEVVPATIDENALDHYFAAMQRPTIDGLNTFIVCRAVQAAGYRVALSGLGGDEALGGYSHYRLLPALALLAVSDRIPGLNRAIFEVGRRLAARFENEKSRRLLLRGGPRTSWELGLLQREVHSPERVRAMTGIDPASDCPADTSRGFTALVEAELANYMQPTLLADADGFSMCSSVELRVPFVDHRLFTALVERSDHLHVRRGKRLLADSLRDPYLLGVCQRKKRGFSVPMAAWMTDGPLDASVSALSDDGAPVWRFVDHDVLRPATDALARGRWSELWSLVSLNQWLVSLSASQPLGLK